MNSKYFHMFAKKRCKHCTKAKKLLEERKLAYVITHMDKAPTALDELKQQCSWKTVPIIFEILGEQEIFIGGCTDLEGYLNGETQEKEGRGEGTDNVVEG